VIQTEWLHTLNVFVVISSLEQHHVEDQEGVGRVKSKLILET
jgi:hypothetical protein